jgi:hypothetical protein
MRTQRGKRILFSEPSELTADVEALARLARTLYAGGGGTGDFFQFYDALEGACLAAVDGLRAGALPACVAEVAAAATVVALAKDYAVSGFVERAASLRAERPEHAETARRVALLGIASQSGSMFARARPDVLALGDEPHVHALVAAMDVVRAGSREGAARLDALAAASPAALSIAWLAEIAARTMGDDARLRRTRRALDELLDSDAHGGGARDAAMMVRLGRDALDPMASALADAWKAVSALEREPPPEDPDEAAYLAKLREEAKESERARRLLESVLETNAELAEDERQELAVYGPFLYLRVPRELGEVLDEPAHYAVMGFRELYGIEILSSALPELAALARTGRAEAN